MFTVFLKQPNISKKMAKNNKHITFHILQNTGYKKVPLQPPSWPKMSVFLFLLTCLFWNLKPFMLKKKAELKSRDTIKARDSKEKTRQNTKKKKTERIVEKKTSNVIF